MTACRFESRFILQHVTLYLNKHRRSESGHTLSVVLFLVQSLTSLTPYTELHNLPVCLHFSSGQILLRKKKLQLLQNAAA